MLHKALVPLQGRAVLSHLFALAPNDAKIVICLGYRGDQIRDYVALAHPQLEVTFIDVEGWYEPGGGPGHSLLAARNHVEGDVVFTTCDTLWERDTTMWQTSTSWAGTAAVPSGTPPERWCRIEHDGEVATELYDKRPGGQRTDAWVGLAYIKAHDLTRLWNGIEDASTVQGERQVSGGLQAIMSDSTLGVRHVSWTDVGDEMAYKRAIAKLVGYDWTKPGEATYVLPDTGRVVKFWSDAQKAIDRRFRGKELDGTVPQPIRQVGSMISYPYVPGVVAYKEADRIGPELTDRLLRWHLDTVRSRTLSRSFAQNVAMNFYHGKTMQRIDMLRSDLRAQALDAVSLINWEALVRDVIPVNFHGDFQYSNIIVTTDGDFVGIDWREDFAGQTWGDLRYDVAKLLASTVVRWDWAQHGDFRTWDEGIEHALAIRQRGDHGRDIEIIGALCLLNSAPLHAPPFDDVLVARGCAWLEEMMS